MTPAEIQSAYPQLSLDDIQSTLVYAADVIRQEIVAPLPA
jgi:uncharacterized protein (DUF433 family)